MVRKIKDPEIDKLIRTDKRYTWYHNKYVKNANKRQIMHDSEDLMIDRRQVKRKQVTM